MSEETSKSSKFSSIGTRFKVNIAVKDTNQFIHFRDSICSWSSQQQLQALMETLSTTEPHYIRCVKPNTVLKPGIFENFNVLNQLRCGVGETWCPLNLLVNAAVQNHFIFPELCSLILLLTCRQGVLEAIRISCAGYPTKRLFDEFVFRFGMLVPDVLEGYHSFNIRRFLSEEAVSKAY